MSHIVEFYVEGLAGKEKGYGQKLNRDVNIFFGLNGSGKTTLLKILHSALSTDPSILANAPFTKAEVVIHSLSYKKQFRYSIDRTPVKPPPQQKSLFGSEEQIESLIDDEIIIDPRARIVRHRRAGPHWKIEPALPKEAGGKWQHRYLPTSRLISRSTVSIETSPYQPSEDFYDTFFARELERHWNEFFGGVQSEVRQIQEKGIASILTEILSSKDASSKTSEVDWESAYDRASAFLKRQKSSSALPPKKIFKERFKQNPVLLKVVNRIDALEIQIARVMEGRTKLQSLIERLFSGNKRLVLGDTSVEVRAKNDVKIGLQSLSSGEKHILRILFDALSAGESSFIIDEPEISLHIDWQNEVIKAIQELNPSLQLIVATHSPEVTAEIDNSKIFQIPV